MDIYQWLSLAFVCLLGAATPGPSLAVIIGHTFTKDKLAGQLASLSHASAIALYAIATSFGLTHVFVLYPVLGDILIYLGAGYLIYMAVGIFLSSVRMSKQVYNPEQSADDSANALAKQVNSKSYLEAIKDAFLIAFLNPKLAVFFIALFSQFIPTEELELSVAAILVSTVFIIDLLWYLAVVTTLDKSRSNISLTNRNKVWLLRLQALIFLLIAFNSVVLR